jgi:hypothetical protein
MKILGPTASPTAATSPHRQPQQPEHQRRADPQQCQQRCNRNPRRRLQHHRRRFSIPCATPAAGNRQRQRRHHRTARRRQPRRRSQQHRRRSLWRAPCHRNGNHFPFVDQRYGIVTTGTIARCSPITALEMSWCGGIIFDSGPTPTRSSRRASSKESPVPSMHRTASGPSTSAKEFSPAAPAGIERRHLQP